MPCQDDYDDRPELYSRLNWYADALCRMCQTHPAALPNDIASWWRAHQEADAKRKAEEMLRQKEKALRKRALSKLTPEEREALDK